MQVLQLEPPPVTTQFSDKPLPAVGSHRLWAADIVVQLLSLRNTAMTSALSDTSLVPRVLALALRHDKCSAMHVRGMQLVKTAVLHRLNGVWQPLFEKGFGCGLLGAGEQPTAPRLPHVAQHHGSLHDVLWHAAVASWETISCSMKCHKHWCPYLVSSLSL
jgi:hypothetical protein